MRRPADGTDFEVANLNDARFGSTVSSNTSLSAAKGLDSCKHYFPALDYQTIAKSLASPLKFLRGCGLPDEYIQHLPAFFN